MAISRPTTPDPEASDQAIGRNRPGEPPEDNDVELQQELQDKPEKDEQHEEHEEHEEEEREEHEHHDAHIIQASRGSPGGKPEREASAQPDDSDEASSSAESAESAESGEEEDDTAEPSKDSDKSTANASSNPLNPSNQSSTAEQDDGWDCHWDAVHQNWFFHNRITNESTWENPRVSSQAQASVGTSLQPQTSATMTAPPASQLPAGGYNPAIHGDYDPNAWYAKGNQDGDEGEVSVMDTATAYAAIGSFNRFTGRWQGGDQGPDRHNDESKSRRQMNAFFDVDAAANAHNGRSLKAERSGKKPTKTELKQFKEKRRARKEEKRRAWLRD
ncbi:hypothetical protein GGR50DRAFT_490902 [Xylaria sp. CBS 124048]|nr:hypothetical protein GGR50DRAFT_490902 [Xylaria sp. CBS 124048]